MADGIERTKELTKRAVGKCTPNADRLSNAVKSLIDKVMKGQIFENASALGILQWLLCSEDLKTLASSIPPWWYDGTSTNNPNNPQEQVTPEQEYFYARSNGVPGLLDKLRTLQFGSENALGSTPSFTDKLSQQQSQLNTFKAHTDEQSGVGDPTTFQRTVGTAIAYDSAKQQMEGKDQDNFTGFFNSTIQGPVILEQMKNLLCVPDSLGQMLRGLLDLIAGILPFTLDDIIGLLGGMGLDAFFDKLDSMLSDLAGFFEYLNYIVSLDLSQFSLGQAYVQKFSLGQFLAAIANGDGRGNCIARAMLEEFTGSDNLRDSITAINIERDKEQKAAANASAANTELGKQRANEQKNTDKEMFFDPVADELILAGIVTGTPTPTPPALSPEALAAIQERLLVVEQRTMQVGYRVASMVTPTPDTDGIDGGTFDENEFGGSDGIVLVYTPTPTPSPSGGVEIDPGGGFISE